jgi:hypothetical protein
VRQRTKSPPIQFRLPLADYAVLEDLAAAEGLDTPKDLVLGMTLERVAEERRAREAVA